MEAARGLELAAPMGPAFWYSEISFWAWRTGQIQRLPDGTFEPFLLHAAGRHREAAAAWTEIGCPYEAGLALADGSDEADLRDALGLFLGLNARAMADRVSERLRALGARHVARGPRPSTRANPAGLSAREIEVLQLLALGARNTEIAERLVLSPKTVDHHVSAILRKLGVEDRAAARRKAQALGLQDGGPSSPR
jgi:DNA-binding CsgD family transcriptional regulator